MAGDMILDNIEEFLFDEDRVVSYKWLSRTLSLHVNQAKSKLEEFAEQWREKNESKPITLTFFISGTQETTSGNELNKVAIVKEENVENVKKSLKKTLCEHIYSIQKSNLKDTAALYQADFDSTRQHLSECTKYSAINCKAAKATTKQSSSPPPPANKFPNGDVGHQSKPKEDTAPPPGKGSLSSNDKAKKKTGLASFMTKSKTEPKPGAKSGAKELSPKETAPKQQKSKLPKKGSLLHAFQSSKKTSKPSEAKDRKEEPETELSKESKIETASEKHKEAEMPATSSGKDEMTSSTSKKEKESKKKESPKVAPVKEQKKKQKKLESKKASKRDISKIDAESKEKGSKRRRVIRLEESSSSEDEEEEENVIDLLEEEEEEEEMDDTPIPPTPEPRSRVTQEEERKQSSPSQDEETGGKRKKKVWKKKRYLDDEGCMVTEKVFEYESGEDSVAEEPAEPSTEKSSPSGGDNKETSSPNEKSTKKSSPPSSGRKQMALTSFFKKR